ncbi:MAG TPA: tetratricopeptide repeat protein [Gemmatimonadales bacterium]|nr:tetratricopeptide repeat protein [Gemmatimonadales bacterium]
MYRPLYLAGIGYLAVCGAVLVLHQRHPKPTPPPPPPAMLRFDGNAEQWYAAMKPYCNAVEVAVFHRQHPAPQTTEGQGYSAACYALAGHIDSARAVIERLPTEDHYRAAGIVFDVGHPVADAGDDRSAGPIMELVLEYWPNQYMALYHAGMSEYALGQRTLARSHLESFLTNYSQDDGWTRNAREVLARIR